MEWWRILLASSTLGTVVTISADAYMRSEVFNYHDSVTEPSLTSIVIPTLNEEAYLNEALASLESQNIKRFYPSKFETIIMDGGSQDDTVAIAKNFNCQIFQVPRGKLTARHIGILNSKGHIIISADADTYYPPNYLNLVSKAFKDSQVVGVSSPRLFRRDSNIIIDTAGIWKALADGSVGGRMPGSSSAFRKNCYYKVGGFNLEINQFNSREIVQEEEYIFPKLLRRVGKVIWLWKAPAYTSARRWVKPLTERRSFKKVSENGFRAT